MTCHLSEAERIKDRLRAAKSAVEVNRIADEERATVQAMARDEGDGATMARQIANLKAYKLDQFQ